MADEVEIVSGGVGRSVGAIAMGLFVALLGYAAAFSQGMMTAPSHAAGAVAMAVLAAGLCLSLFGMVSLRWSRLRPAAAKGTIIAAGLLVLAFAAGKVGDLILGS